MALVQQAVGLMTKKLPKMISPRTHAIIDYATVGTFILMGALFWKKNKKASIAAFSCAAAEATTVLLTDFPGGVTDVISFETHGRIDSTIAGATVALPNTLGFSPCKLSFSDELIFSAACLALVAFRGYSIS